MSEGAGEIRHPFVVYDDNFYCLFPVEELWYNEGGKVGNKKR